LFSLIAKASQNFFNSVSYKEEVQHRILAENFQNENLGKDLSVKTDEVSILELYKKYYK
tara:strand:- start:1179 stop:1355 length:177 start_codon:yes stop_codon:yes gene_type:complete